MKRRLTIPHILLLSAILLFASCFRGQMTHKAVRQAAEKYYTMLIEGDYKGFVEGHANASQLPEAFRSQLVDATAQFMTTGRMCKLGEVVAISDSLFEDSTAYVMLQLNYNDSTSEQIELALVLEEDGWKMK